MKHALALTALLTLAASPATAAVPRTTPFTKTVDLTTTSQTTLAAALATLTRSIGVNLVVQGLPAVTVTQGIKGVPAWQAIDTLLKVHAPTLDTHYDGKFLIVAPSDTISALKGQDRVITVTPTAVDDKQASALTTVIPGLIVLPFGEKASILAGSPTQVREAEALLAPSTAPAPVAPPAAPPVTESLLVGPLNPADVTTILKESYPDLRVVNAGTRVIVTGSAGGVLQARSLLTALIEDAETRKPQVSAAPVVMTPAITTPEQVTQRLNLTLDPATVTKVASASSEDVKVIALEPGTYLLLGAQPAVTTVTADLRAAETRIKGLALVPYPLRYAGADLVPVLQRAVPAATIEFVPGTRQLLVRAGADDHAVLAALLRQLDVRASGDADREVTTELLTLKLASAKDLAAVLAPPSQGSQGQGAQGQAGQGQAAGTPDDTRLTVSVDDRSNTLVLRGTRADVLSAIAVARALDTELPNVTVHLNVRQVDNSDGRNLGIDWQAGMGGVTVGGGASGLSVAYSPAATAPTVRVNLGAQDSKTNGKTLLDTSLTTQSGRPGKLLSGGTLMVPKSTKDSEGNVSSNGYEQYDYGLEVRVTPRAVVDGRVELTITTIIGEAPTFGASGSISINKRQVDTVVTLRPNQSVTLGGIITTTELNQQSGVPFLSQIPIIGALFGKTTSSKGSAVLLMTLTADSNLFKAAQAAAGPTPAPAAGVTQAAAATAAAASATTTVLQTTTTPGTNGTSSSTIVPPKAP